MKRLAGTAVIACVLAASLPAQASPAPTAEPMARSVVAAFSLVTPQGASPSGLVARAVVQGGTRCPVLKTTNRRGHLKSTTMVERKAPATTSNIFHPLVSCSAPIPAGAVSARVRSQSIPAALPKAVNDLAIFGDTGCRMKGSTLQACNDPAAWPLATLAATVAAQAPDLIIFTGDFFYREAVCPPASTPLCGGSPTPGALPFKDSADGWNVDVFTPMAAALSAAPVAVVRGNHEDCNRGGNGYFIYMDPREGTEDTCAPVLDDSGVLVAPAPDVTAPYFADIAISADRNLRLVVVDSAGDEDCVTTSLLDKETAYYTQAQEMARGSKESWLLVHRPVVGWQVNDDCAPDGSWIAADQQVASYGLLGDYDMVLSSHVHLVEAMNIPGVPGQLILGNGATLLEAQTPFVLPTTGPNFDPTKAYAPPTSGWWNVRFGYAMAHPGSGGSWTMDMESPEGERFASCLVADKRVDCADLVQ